MTAMPNLTTKDDAVNNAFATAETQVASEPILDLNTLNTVHQYWEFVCDSDIEFDAWLHAHVKKAMRLAAKEKGKKA